ncbi:hypothetical protein F4779DRAFT_65649 [Xylariaceae sp. FL0662B]|nr:hypothetical protein F4779DRAFT_65649 [Xylariaceae sp. FL0662B]
MGIPKMAIIATATKEPRTVVHQSSGIPTILAPTLQVALRCQHLLSTASLLFYLRVTLLASQILWAGRIIAVQSFITSRLIGCHAAVLGHALWNTRAVKRLRKKFVFEFFTLILGSGGNNLCLMIFWPGWWVLVSIGLTARVFVS